MFVRTASARDIDAIRQLLVATWHDTYDSIYGIERVTEITDAWHAPEALKKRLDTPDSEFLVADDGRSIGGVAFARATDGGETVMLHQLYVSPASQGSGIGTMLLDEVASCFPQARRIRLEVEEANAGAVAFYLRRGFCEAGRTGDCGGAGFAIPALILEQQLG